MCSKLERGEERGGDDERSRKKRGREGRGKERLEEKGREKAGKLFNLKSRISAKNIHTTNRKGDQGLTALAYYFCLGIPPY